MLLIYLGKTPRTNTCKKLGDSTLQTILLISLFVIEIVAFGWLIWEAKLGREKREQINPTRKRTNIKTRKSYNIYGKKR